MKKYNFIAAAVVAIMAVFGLSSCDKEDVPTPEPEKDEVADCTVCFIASPDLIDVTNLYIQVVHKNHTSETCTIMEKDFKEVSDMKMFENLVTEHNAGVGKDHPDTKINSASDLKKYYKAYTYTVKNVKSTDVVTATLSKTVKKAVTEEELNSKDLFLAFHLGKIAEGEFYKRTGREFFIEKGSEVTKDYIKDDLFLTDFDKEVNI